MTDVAGLNDDKDIREIQGRVIAALLRHGTWLASATIGAGLAVLWLRPMTGTIPFGVSGVALMKIGVALFIFLPVLRVALMLFLFARERDTVYTAISALVLAIMAAGFLSAI